MSISNILTTDTINDERLNLFIKNVEGKDAKFNNINCDSLSTTNLNVENLNVENLSVANLDCDILNTNAVKYKQRTTYNIQLVVPARTPTPYRSYVQVEKNGSKVNIYIRGFQAVAGIGSPMPISWYGVLEPKYKPAVEQKVPIMCLEGVNYVMGYLKISTLGELAIWKAGSQYGNFAISGASMPLGFYDCFATYETTAISEIPPSEIVQI